jgi:hypothetical protein
MFAASARVVHYGTTLWKIQIDNDVNRGILCLRCRSAQSAASQIAGLCLLRNSQGYAVTRVPSQFVIDKSRAKHDRPRHRNGCSFWRPMWHRMCGSAVKAGDCVMMIPTGFELLTININYGRKWQDT